MSLLTPPGTSQRGKENRAPRCSNAGSRVVWSQHNQYHVLPTSPPGKLVTSASASKEPPTKSILKKSTHPLLPIPEENQRETTPEPGSPAEDATYLASPVAKIVAADSSLRDVIEGYSILTVRIRAHLDAEDASKRVPLVDPLVASRDQLAAAIVEHLGKAMVDPSAGRAKTVLLDRDVFSLPSPKESPKKKRGGMTAEEVKYARDLCTTSHAAIKFLAAGWTIPAVYNIFTDEQLSDMLTALLAIPLASEVPTPNARKTCALSIWLLQIQRLPVEVLLPAKDRIAYALRRGVEGELGKEGKKGSVSDGLRAIHDLSIHQPTTFVPSLVELLPSILSSLLAPTLVLRTQACVALGGFVRGLVTLPHSSLQTRISNHVETFLTTLPPPSPKKSSGSSPSPASQDPTIIRTLRTTLQAIEPQHAAQGPVWALCVMANLLILLGPAVYTNEKLMRTLSALMSLALRQKKSSVRVLSYGVWRTLTYVYHMPSLLQEKAEDGEDEDFHDHDHDDAQRQKHLQGRREAFWKVVKSMVDMGAGTGNIAALLSAGPTHPPHADVETNLRAALEILNAMVKKGGESCADAIKVVKRFLSLDNIDMPDEEWHPRKLLPPSLFSTVPGLLTTDWKALSGPVGELVNECPCIEDIRPLDREELSKDWVFENLIQVWRESITLLEISPRMVKAPEDVVAVWDGLVQANVATLQDCSDDDATSKFAQRAVEILSEILYDPRVNLKVGPTTSRKSTHVERSTTELKLLIIREFWASLRTAVPSQLLTDAGELFISRLQDRTHDILKESETSVPDLGAWEHWALLCTDVLLVCEVNQVKAFWSSKDGGTAWAWSKMACTMVWNTFLEEWAEAGKATWDGIVALLAVPFVDSHSWNISPDQLETWDSALWSTIGRAHDYGFDPATVLDQIAQMISSAMWQNPLFSTPSTRVADMLLGHLDITEARSVPADLFQLVNDSLLTSYPSEPRNKVTCMWLIRSLARAIDTCPVELLVGVLEIVQEGVSMWIADECKDSTDEEYSFDIVPLYQTILVSLQSLSLSSSVITSMSMILEASFSGRQDKPSSMSEAFVEFWLAVSPRVLAPEGGWPESIQKCLLASGICESLAPIVRPVDAEYDADVSFDNCDDEVEAKRVALALESGTAHLTNQTAEEDPLVFPDSGDEDESPPSLHQHKIVDRSPFVGHLGPAIFTPQPSLLRTALPASELHRDRLTEPSESSDGQSPSTNLDVPVTPSSSRTNASTPPPRLRRKHSGDVASVLQTTDILQDMPSCPESPTPTRFSSTRITPFQPTPNRRDEGTVSVKTFYPADKNKENLSPGKADTTSLRVIGKRRRSLSGPVSENIESKKGKYLGVSSMAVECRSSQPSSGSSQPSSLSDGTAPSVDSNRKSMLNKDEDPFLGGRSDSDDSSDGSSQSTQTLVRSRKRSRVFMEAVEIPPFHDRRAKWRPMTPDDVLNLSNMASAASQSQRRYSMGVLKPISNGLRDDRQSPSKRRRLSWNGCDAAIEDAEELSPSKFFDGLDVVLGSDDSMFARTPSSQLPVQSDCEDPLPSLLGNVTPHHLISPALRRVREADFSDPPSDDSTSSESSPSRAHLKRKLARSLSSDTMLKPMPLTIFMPVAQ
ncbi:hypothetical protein JAAARDRAFT_203629 [Jaapia argillacea MUCL 33604]|uniref:Telomere-associated protein Rif1 N-terminal domain-containing protein n=1 Tax=Jaapia argillacea MUCL 33604 TaxID=933084 RepID=A0A067Q641_9AGAM|nr:hypothetical protein JAAARDRAFT_203629 [Jaapia argillacea MUCL 33604]